MSFGWRKKKNGSDHGCARQDALTPAKESTFRRPFCPVTCNLPTKMPREIFTRICTVNRNSDDENYCNQVCRGKLLPTGLQFVEPVTFMNEDNAMTKYKSGTCSLCGKEKQVLAIMGKDSCASCNPIWAAARNIPDLVVKALLEEQSEDWIDSHFVKNLTPAVDALADLEKVRLEQSELRDRNLAFFNRLATELDIREPFDIDDIVA